MLAFQNTVHTKESAVALAKLHRDQDDFIRGTYGETTKNGGWKGCSVGCMAKGKHKDYPELFGIDVRVAYLSDRFFENIPDYKNWTVNLFESIKDGSDTTIAYYKFMHWMLADYEFGVVKFNKHLYIIRVADLFLSASKGYIITNEKWRSAAAAAADAAYTTASYAASYAAAAASYAAASYGAAAAAADAAGVAASYAAKKNHYRVMAKKLMWFLAGNS